MHEDEVEYKVGDVIDHQGWRFLIYKMTGKKNYSHRCFILIRPEGAAGRRSYYDLNLSTTGSAYKYKILARGDNT